MDKIRVETLKKKIAYDLVNTFDWSTIITLCLQDHINRTELETMLKYGGEYMGHTTQRHSTSVIMKYQKMITDAVYNTDVRCMNKLIDAMKHKSLLPKWIRQGNYLVDMDDNCEWCLFKKGENE